LEGKKLVPPNEESPKIIDSLLQQMQFQNPDPIDSIQSVADISQSPDIPLKNRKLIHPLLISGVQEELSL